MAKITKIETIQYRLPTRREFRWAGLQDSIGGFVCVKVYTDEGVIGYGEATPLPDWGGDYHRHCGETMNSVEDIIMNVFAPLLVGEDPTNIVKAHQIMDTYVRGNTYAKCAVDIALYDAWGKLTGLPVYKLLGGKVRESVQVGHMIGLMPMEEARIEARGAYEDGIRAFQIKSGEDFEDDVKTVKMLREEFGSDVWLRLDANKGYGDRKTALNILRKMTDEKGNPLLDMVEQPVEGFEDMAFITSNVPMKTITDESTWNLADAFEAVKMQATDAMSIYLAKAGGLYEAQKIAMLCDTYHIPVDTNGSLESAIGTAANVHFCLSQPAATLPSVISINAPAGKHICKFAGHFYEDDICVDALPVKDGAILALEKPGLGIEIDEEKLEKYRVRK